MVAGGGDGGVLDVVGAGFNEEEEDYCYYHEEEG